MIILIMLRLLLVYVVYKHVNKDTWVDGIIHQQSLMTNTYSFVAGSFHCHYRESTLKK